MPCTHTTLLSDLCTSSLGSLHFLNVRPVPHQAVHAYSQKNLHPVNELRIHVYTMLYNSGRRGFTVELNGQPQSYIYWIQSDVLAHYILTQPQPSRALLKMISSDLTNFTLISPASRKQISNLHQHLPVKPAHVRYHRVHYQILGDPCTHTHSLYCTPVPHQRKAFRTFNTSTRHIIFSIQHAFELFLADTKSHCASTNIYNPEQTPGHGYGRSGTIA